MMKEGKLEYVPIIALSGDKQDVIGKIGPEAEFDAVCTD